jgi:hypothetical protein
VQRFILVASPATATESLHVVLKLSFHNSTDRNNISTNAWVNKVIFDFAVYSLWHFTCVYVLNIVINLLKPDPLEERSLCSVLFRVKNSWAAVNRNAAIRSFPFAIDKIDVDVHFTVMALELYAFNQNFDRWNSQHSAAYAHKLVDQVGFDLR